LTKVQLYQCNFRPTNKVLTNNDRLSSHFLNLIDRNLIYLDYAGKSFGIIGLQNKEQNDGIIGKILGK